MAALLKKRALAEYSQAVTQEPAQVLIKRVRLEKKTIKISGNISLIDVVTHLEDCKTSNEVLELLLRVSDISENETENIPEIIRKLSEHFKREAESAVRVKLLSILCEIGLENPVEAVNIIDETIILIKNDHSHKVIAKGMKNLLQLGKVVSETTTGFHKRLVNIAKHYLKDTNHAVKCNCLEIIGTHSPLVLKKVDELLRLISFYFNNDDARVRSKAIGTVTLLYERGFKINPNIYVSVCEALKDDYEIVRSVALKLIYVLGNAFPENHILVPDSAQEIRLIDDAFNKICSGVVDLSMQVRTLAATLLGKMDLVSAQFLNQTLDKKLMSNMRRKRTAHELSWQNLTSGEFDSGKKWANDSPKELLRADTINLMSSGACGAFVHGLEDEYLEVRSAAVDSICQLSISNCQFANMALDFLVDMFNDEIEDVRCKAIDSLRKISKHIILRDDQVETMLGALEDFSQDIREGLHRMFAACKLATAAGLRNCVEKLLNSLKKYPQDKRSTYKCLQCIGSHHPDLVVSLVPVFLNYHPIFDLPEPDVENPHYICLLILVFNSAKESPTICALLEAHTLRHYAYLRDTMPQFVPALSFAESSNFAISTPLSVPESLEFLINIISNLDLPENMRSAQISVLETAKDQLDRLSGMDAMVSGTAQFTAMFIGAQVQLLQMLERGYWMNPLNLATQQLNTLQFNIKKLLEYCLKLEYLFVGLNKTEKCIIKLFKLKALALNFVYIVRGNSSALEPCTEFLMAMKKLEKELNLNGIQPDVFFSTINRKFESLDEKKPGAVAKIIIPALLETRVSTIPRPNTDIRKTSVTILNPTGHGDTSLKFTAGLIMSVPFEAELKYLQDTSNVRLKMKYPDQKQIVILPKPAHFKTLYYDTSNAESQIGENVHLITSVLISHQVWSEACNVEVNVALCIPETKKTSKNNSSLDGDISMIDLCRPVKISVAPKPIKKTL